MDNLIHRAILFAVAALAAASAQQLYGQSLDSTLADYARFVKPESERGGDPREFVVTPPRDAVGAGPAGDADQTGPVPEITIRVAPFYCPPCNALKRMDWDGFDVHWEIGGADAYPQISWMDSDGTRRVLTGPYRPDQVRWSWERTNLSTSGEWSRVNAAQSPTPYHQIIKALELADFKSGETFADIGCGDGRALILASEFGAEAATGVEVDGAQAALARRRVAQSGFSDRAHVIEGDATKIDLPAADVAFVYLYHDLLEELRGKLIAKYDRIVSYQHQIPGLSMRKRGDVWLWERRKPVATAMQTPRRGAVWGGRVYYGRVCNSPGCRMCNSIARQLSGR